MRRATVRTTHATPATAEIVAGAIEPDNTDSMTTRVEGSTVETTIERETTGGLHSSVDDYVVNLTVANRLAGTDDSDTVETDTTAVTDTRDEPTADHTDTTHDNHE
ncbi:KEOPS complex subunit Pcc1 [Salinigranum halophilum]|uniref:KEOPS complex subunit Pcc1 n=1 Tax=Salinigranum halophilum TaxID=2565931 RepID=UPI00115D9DC3|nr:KEOPS complex subunit Pcc1 [Salinigranum halophilum]